MMLKLLNKIADSLVGKTSPYIKELWYGELIHVEDGKDDRILLSLGIAFGKIIKNRVNKPYLYDYVTGDVYQIMELDKGKYTTTGGKMFVTNPRRLLHDYPEIPLLSTNEALRPNYKITSENKDEIIESIMVHLAKDSKIAIPTEYMVGLAKEDKDKDIRSEYTKTLGRRAA